MKAGTWPPDSVIALLTSDTRFERVPADVAYARRVADELAEEECDLALYSAAKGRWSKVNTLTYDAARKGVEALLLSIVTTTSIPTPRRHTARMPNSEPWPRTTSASSISCVSRSTCLLEPSSCRPKRTSMPSGGSRSLELR